jgi:hypothetical protein
LICHAPRPDTRLIVADGGSRTNSSGALISTRYAWEGAVQPGMRLQFVQVFLPHAPARDASALAKGIQFLKNEPGMAAVTVRQGGRVEMVLLNRDGAKAELTAPGDAKLEIETDARQCYVVAEAARPKRVLLRDGSYLAINREPIFVQINRGQFEKEF